MSKLIKISNLVLSFVGIIGLSSCNIYNSASAPIFIGDFCIGMDKNVILAKYGQPFTFEIRISGNDTISVLSYKTPKAVRTSEFIVTTKLLFVNNKLKTISQSDFYVPQNAIFCDSTKVLLNKGGGFKK